MEYESLVIAGLVQILEFLSAQGIREPELFGGALNSEEVDKIEALLGRGMAVDFESSHPRDAAAALKNLIQETKKKLFPDSIVTQLASVAMGSDAKMITHFRTILHELEPEILHVLGCLFYFLKVLCETNEYPAERLAFMFTPIIFKVSLAKQLIATTTALIEFSDKVFAEILGTQSSELDDHAHLILKEEQDENHFQEYDYDYQIKQSRSFDYGSMESSVPQVSTPKGGKAPELKSSYMEAPSLSLASKPALFSGGCSPFSPKSLDSSKKPGSALEEVNVFRPETPKAAFKPRFLARGVTPLSSDSPKLESPPEEPEEPVYPFALDYEEKDSFGLKKPLKHRVPLHIKLPVASGSAAITTPKAVSSVSSKVPGALTTPKGASPSAGMTPKASSHGSLKTKISPPSEMETLFNLVFHLATVATKEPDMFSSKFSKESATALYKELAAGNISALNTYDNKVVGAVLRRRLAECSEPLLSSETVSEIINIQQRSPLNLKALKDLVNSQVSSSPYNVFHSFFLFLNELCRNSEVTHCEALSLASWISPILFHENSEQCMEITQILILKAPMFFKSAASSPGLEASKGPMTPRLDNSKIKIPGTPRFDARDLDAPQCTIPATPKAGISSLSSTSSSTSGASSAVIDFADYPAERELEILVLLLTFLCKHGTKEPNMFAGAVDKHSAKFIDRTIDSQGRLDLSRYPLQSIGAVVKRRLVFLEKPLFPLDCVSRLHNLQEKYACEPKMLKDLLKASLSERRFLAVSMVFAYLSKLAAKSEITSCTAASLSEDLSPFIFREHGKVLQGTVYTMISKYKEIFM